MGDEEQLLLPSIEKHTEIHTPTLKDRQDSQPATLTVPPCWAATLTLQQNSFMLPLSVNAGIAPFRLPSPNIIKQFHFGKDMKFYYILESFVKLFLDSHPRQGPKHNSGCGVKYKVELFY